MIERSSSTVTTALAWAAVQGVARLDAQLLLLHALKKPGTARAWLLAHDADPLAASVTQDFVAAVRRRAGSEPLAYITGQKEFFGLDLRVDPRVLIPRPDTETLVQWALDALPRVGPGVAQPLTAPPGLLDLGTGSGAIALAVKHQRPDVTVCGVDASTAALQVARTNGERLGLPVDWRVSDWFSEVSGYFDVIASNPPYVAPGDPHLVALKHEPVAALVADAQGLDDLRRIINAAPAYLKPGGWLLLEHGFDQSGAVCQLLRERGFNQVQSRLDLAGIARCSGGQWQTADNPAKAT